MSTAPQTTESSVPQSGAPASSELPGDVQQNRSSTETVATLPDALILTPFRQRVVEQRLGVRAIHLHRPGRPEVVHRFEHDAENNVYSVSKTVTALAFGIAREEGLLDLDDRIVDHVPAPAESLGEGVEGITLRHLLTMTSGSPVTAFADDERDDPDLAARFLRTDLVAEPGQKYEYSNGSTFMVARAIAARAGSSLRDYLMPRLFEPLGIVNPQWHATRDGHSWGATGLHLRSGQLAAIGELLLARGSRDGRQLVPAAWIDALHAEDTWVRTGWEDQENARYGFGVWGSTPQGSWRADGAYGQFLLVMPEQDAVIAISSHLEGRSGSEILTAVWEELLPLL